MSTVRHSMRYIIVFFSSEELISCDTLLYHQVLKEKKPIFALIGSKMLDESNVAVELVNIQLIQRLK